MRKLLVIGLLGLSGVAYAGLIGNTLDSAATSGWPTKETKKYKLNMYGFDARAYEFTTDNGLKCVAVFPGGSATGWQMQCTPAALPR